MLIKKVEAAEVIEGAPPAKSDYEDGKTRTQRLL